MAMGAEKQRGRGVWRPLPWGFAVAAAAFALVRFLWLRADFPNFSPWALDQAKYTDEGWWANAAVAHQLLGHWHVAGDYNPAVVVPVWPLVLGALFHFTGVSMLAARSASVLASVATLWVVYALVRRYTQPGDATAAVLAVVLLATSPFAFAFSRLAVLDTFVVFQFAVLLLVASYAEERRIAALSALAVLLPVIVLTKTTAVVLLPAVLWLAWCELRETTTARSSFRLIALVAVVAGFLFRAYVALVFLRGYGRDYRYFFQINQVQDIDWRHALAIFGGVLENGMWMGRIVFPVAVGVMIVAVMWMRAMWSNALFTTCVLAIAGQGAFLFITQDDVAPRYFLAMLVPLVIATSLAVGEMRTRWPRVYLGAMTPIIVAVILNVSAIVSLLQHRTFQFYDAATAIGRIVRSDPQQKPLILGVSAGELSLITGIPSLIDVYGTDSLDVKALAYRPGWYVAWNSIGGHEQQMLASYNIIPVASYPAFDDDERNRLILYRLELRTR